MYTYTHMYVYVCIYIYICIHQSYTCIYMYIHMYVQCQNGKADNDGQKQYIYRSIDLSIYLYTYRDRAISIERTDQILGQART